jgi:hypothetical protein
MEFLKVQLILVREHLISDTSVESQLNNNGTAGPLPGSGKLGGILICLLKIYSSV